LAKGVGPTFVEADAGAVPKSSKGSELAITAQSPADVIV
jgi:hypothetical protein